MTEIHVGDKVTFIAAEAHEEYPRWFPEAGTVGVVIDRDCIGKILVRWPAGAVETPCWISTEFVKEAPHG